MALTVRPLRSSCCSVNEATRSRASSKKPPSPLARKEGAAREDVKDFGLGRRGQAAADLLASRVAGNVGEIRHVWRAWSHAPRGTTRLRRSASRLYSSRDAERPEVRSHAERGNE